MTSNNTAIITVITGTYIYVLHDFSNQMIANHFVLPDNTYFWTIILLLLQAFCVFIFNLSPMQSAAFF